MGQIILSSKVEAKLESLAYILYKKEYFGFLDSAEKYVDEIENTMYSIPDL